MFSRLSVRFRTLASGALALLAASVSAQVAVTTYHYDNLRTGLNSHETKLTPATVTPANFGLLFSLPVDGQVYAQPLYLPGLSVAGKGVHNVVFVATEHNSLYAFDADNNAGSNAAPLWQDNFGPSVPNGDTGSDDINPEIGITSTPVIDLSSPRTPLIYVISKTKGTDSNGNPTYTQALHAINAGSGTEAAGSPIVIQGSVPGTGVGSVNGVLTFDPLIQHARPGLLLVPPTNPKAAKGTPAADSLLYVTFASHGDNGPYHGWVFVYDVVRMQLIKIIATTPNAQNDPSGYPIAAGGIWQGGGGPATDGTSVYFATGNGTFDPSTGAFGDSILRIDTKTFTIADYFTPSDQLSLDDYDTDLGSGEVMLLPASASGTSGKSFLVQSGKEGTIYLLNTANLGGYNNPDQVQELPYAIGGIWGSPAFFNNTIFFGPVYSSIVSFPIANGQFTSTTPTAYTPTQYQYPGPTPSVSANGTTGGIVWAIQTDAYTTAGPAVLHAYDATNLATELYNSSATQGRDTFGTAVKFATPMVANGKVYAGSGGQVGVFGIGTFAATPQVTPPSGNYVNSVQVTVKDATPNAQIRYTTDGTDPISTSPLYTTPITLTASAVFKAKAFLAGSGSSAVVENDYLINAVIGNGTGLYGAYYNGIQDATGTPTAGEVDPQVNFNWNGNPPVAGVGGSNWAGEWSGQIQAETTGSYTLTTNSDDGVEVFINGQLVISDYTYHAPTYDSATLNFVAGQKYDIDIKYFQGGGGSLLQLFWQAQGLPFQVVPQSQLYPGAAQPAISPVGGVYSTNIQVSVTEATPNATVYYTTDGTIPTMSSTPYQGPVNLTTSAAFKARAFVNGVGGAVAENDYLVNAVIGTGDGLWGSYYNNSQNPGGTPTVTEVDPQINWNWNGNPPVPGVAGTNWAGEWTGQIQAESTGTYTFTSYSDDGVQVSINGQLLINDYTYHAPTYDSGSINLVAGQKYSIDIKYFQGGGGSLLQLFWQSVGLPYQLVPQSQLYSGH